jgi:transposase, IS6 family
MAIAATNPFNGRQYPDEVILQAIRWYLRYPLAYVHVAELLAERGVEVDASCVGRWVQAYSPELNKRCRSHLKRTNKSAIPSCVLPSTVAEKPRTSEVQPQH